MGWDSTAVLLRWRAGPTSWDDALSDLTVMTARVGEEFVDTKALVEAHILRSSVAPAVMADKAKNRVAGAWKHRTWHAPVDDALDRVMPERGHRFAIQHRMTDLREEDVYV